MLPLVTIFHAEGDVLLRQSTPVLAPEQIRTPSVQKLIQEMIKTMRSAKGIGLAAPQVGQSIRLAVIHKQADRSLKKDLVLINPELAQPSVTEVDFEEGCLSIPDVYGLVMRPETIQLTAYDGQGKIYTIDATGLLARVAQHEVDHLNGRLFIDRTDRITQGRELLA